MDTITVSTHRKDQVVDITETVAAAVRKAEPEQGVCVVFAAHTTCALTTADLDPGTDLDLLEALRKVVPRLPYRHPHNPGHVSDHILASLIGPSVAIPYAHRQLLLGTWQRIILIELDGPRQRTLYLHCLA